MKASIINVPGFILHVVFIIFNKTYLLMIYSIDGKNDIQYNGKTVHVTSAASNLQRYENIFCALRKQIIYTTILLPLFGQYPRM